MSDDRVGEDRIDSTWGLRSGSRLEVPNHVSQRLIDVSGIDLRWPRRIDVARSRSLSSNFSSNPFALRAPSLNRLSHSDRHVPGVERTARQGVRNVHLLPSLRSYLPSLETERTRRLSAPFRMVGPGPLLIINFRIPRTSITNTDMTHGGCGGTDQRVRSSVFVPLVLVDARNRGHAVSLSRRRPVGYGRRAGRTVRRRRAS
jgi:hypothetical protein